MVLIVGSWFGFFLVSGFGVIFIGFGSCVVFWFVFGWFTGFCQGLVSFGPILGFCSNMVSSLFLYNSLGGFNMGGFYGEGGGLVLFWLVCSIFVMVCCIFGLVRGVVLLAGLFFGFLATVGDFSWRFGFLYLRTVKAFFRGRVSFSGLVEGSLLFGFEGVVKMFPHSVFLTF